jgi:hypothetical protein
MGASSKVWSKRRGKKYNHFDGTETNTSCYSLNLLTNKREYMQKKTNKQKQKTKTRAYIKQ